MTKNIEISPKTLAQQVRRDIVRMVYEAKSGHPGGSLGCVETLVSLYLDVMDLHSEFRMNGQNEDMFFLSNGHISPVWYSVLARIGYFEVRELATFRQINSRLQGHPTPYEHLPGVRVASGSLGQGLSVAAGAALAKRLAHEKNKVFVLMGDGEQQEGQIWEAASFAAHHKLDNLIAMIDVNGIQIDGRTQDVMNNRDLAEKWKSFGWEVEIITDANDYDLVTARLKSIKAKQNQPVCVLLHTVMGKGVDYMENSHKWHGNAPNQAQFESAMNQLPSDLLDY
ncbi:MAG: transketolase [Chitinophagales bacterium]|jgi:transketolase|nr:transketolase [Chitinophagales bacterium]